LWEKATGIAAEDTVVKLLFDYPLSTEDIGGETRLLAGSDDGNLFESFRNFGYTGLTIIAIFGAVEISSVVSSIGIANAIKGVSLFPNASIGGFNLSTDNGKSWKQNNSGLPSNPKTSALSGTVNGGGESLAEVNFYIGFFENMNGGARVFKITYIVTDVEQVSSQVPESYKLNQNYPNPFNPRTTIQFSIPAVSYVSLEVFNALGENVEVLVSEELSAGTYKYEWKADDLTSGIYFYRLSTESFSESKKMILLK